MQKTVSLRKRMTQADRFVLICTKKSKQMYEMIKPRNIIFKIKTVINY